ncbi:cytidylate kinase-like family protein [Amycolatopsis sp. NPDC005003]
MARTNKVLISGWTAAGKTTHARLVAAELGWTYLDMSPIMKQLTAVNGSRDWTPEQDDIRRRDRTIDLEADRRMLELVSDSSSVIVDAWLQPWLCRSATAVRVWLRSSWAARVRKCTVSHLRHHDHLSAREAAALMHRKDCFARKQFAYLYGVRFDYDPALFDLHVDNSAYIAESSVAASDVGIREFQPVLMRHVEALLERGSRR